MVSTRSSAAASASSSSSTRRRTAPPTTGVRTTRSRITAANNSSNSSGSTSSNSSGSTSSNNNNNNSNSTNNDAATNQSVGRGKRKRANDSTSTNASTTTIPAKRATRSSTRRSTRTTNKRTKSKKGNTSSKDTKKVVKINPMVLAKQQFEQGWVKLESATKKLMDALANDLEHDKVFADTQELMNCYSTCYEICLPRLVTNTYVDFAKDLYAKVSETLKQHLTNQVLPSLVQYQSRKSRRNTSTMVPSANATTSTISNYEKLLEHLDRQWDQFQILKKWTSNFYNYLDRYYVRDHKVDTIVQLSNHTFKSCVYDPMRHDLTCALLTFIQQERDGEMIENKAVMKQMIQMYEAMGMTNLDIYTKDFETYLLKDTTQYYRTKQREWISKDSSPEYLIKVEQVLEAEQTRRIEYFNIATEPKLVSVCQKELLQEVQSNIFEKGCSECMALLINRVSDDLRRMYRLFSKIDEGLVPMAKLFETYVLNLGQDLVNQRKERIDPSSVDRTKAPKEKNSDPEFVRSLLDLHDQCQEIIKNDFENHVLFQKALKNAFDQFINEKVGKFSTAELICSYVDRVLTGGEKMAEVEVEKLLDKVVQIFLFLLDKDIFVEVYRMQLAKRLLNQRSLSHDLEKSMIAKLKIQCGANFTSKIEGMINDLVGAAGNGQKKDFDRNGLTVDFSVQVLTGPVWPTYQSLEVTLPNVMCTCIERYNAYHDNANSARKIAWQFTLGNANVRATFGKNTYDLQVSTLQAIVLDLLSGDVKISFNDLAEKLNLEDHILKPLMHSLSCGKHKIISKSPGCNKISSSDTFVANRKFSSNMRKLRIPMASLDVTHNQVKVEKDRSHAIDAVIVRIMKSRKTMKHQQLQAEVMKQLSFFRPNSRDVKKRIGSLIEREYLDRCSKDNDVYNYLA